MRSWAPELDPIELLWSRLKYDQPGNYTPHGATELLGKVVAEPAMVAEDQRFLRGLDHASQLSLSRALLS